MSAFSNELDIAVLRHIVQNYATELSDAASRSLLEAIQAVQRNEANASGNLTALLRQNPELDRIYEKALRDLRQDYNTQERTKGLIANFSAPASPSFANPQEQSWASELVALLEHSLAKKEETRIRSSQTQILKALDCSFLSVHELAPTIGQPANLTHSLVQKLWAKGYIDVLGSSIPFILFPGLRPGKYRKKQVPPQQFIMLTAKGYFHLHPLFSRLKTTTLAKESGL